MAQRTEIQNGDRDAKLLPSFKFPSGRVCVCVCVCVRALSVATNARSLVCWTEDRAIRLLRVCVGSCLESSGF
jgi:hypothetical protein